MHPIFIVLIIVFASSFIYSAMNPKEDTTQASSLSKEEVATFFGIVYVGMPKEDFEKIGYIQKGYRKEGNEEWITCLDWTTEKPGDLVTFYLEDDKVKG